MQREATICCLCFVIKVSLYFVQYMIGNETLWTDKESPVCVCVCVS